MTDVQEAEQALKYAQERVLVARRQLRIAKRQAACPHRHIEDSGVFGSACIDCDKFFDTGA